MSKNSFSIEGNTIFISHPDWKFIATATVRDDYVEEIQGVTWGLLNKRYPNNAKLGTLHSYVMKKWYGEDFCNEMKRNDFVIDHMDNNSHNCCIENLCFLSNDFNKAKGLTFDKESKDKRFIALTMFKDFETDLFQITIFFNYPATLKLDGLNEPAVVDLAYFLYEGDYRSVILEAQEILVEYKNDYTFRPEKLRAIDYHIEGRIGEAPSPEAHEYYLSGKHGHGLVFLIELKNKTVGIRKQKKSFSF